MAEFKAYWKNYVNFSDRTTRRGFWIPYLIVELISIILTAVFAGGAIMAILEGNLDVGFGGLGLVGIWGLATLIPSIAIGIRRLRDAGFHPALILLNLIVGIGTIVYIVLLCFPSKDTEKNQVPVV